MAGGFAYERHWWSRPSPSRFPWPRRWPPRAVHRGLKACAVRRGRSIFEVLLIKIGPLIDNVHIRLLKSLTRRVATRPSQFVNLLLRIGRRVIPQLNQDLLHLHDGSLKRGRLPRLRDKRFKGCDNFRRYLPPSRTYAPIAKQQKNRLRIRGLLGRAGIRAPLNLFCESII